MWTVIGILLFLLGLLVAIAWHEAGHLAFAKLFKVRTTQYMVGFGKTIWSKRIGETEYGIKAIPLGGYIRMVGMVPPAPTGKKKRFGAPTTTVTGPWSFVRQIVEDTRAGDRAQVTEQDVDRQFYQLHPFKRILIMFAGPLQNLIFAVVLFAILVMAIGVPTTNTTIATVSQCVLPATAPANTTCGPDDPATPAAAAGLLPGDVILEVAGVQITDWPTLQRTIQASAGQTVPLTFDRAGEVITVQVPIVQNTLGVYDERGKLIGTRQAGFLGVVPGNEYVTHDVGAAFTRTADFIGAATRAVLTIPARIPALWNSVFGGGEREIDSPVGIVGAGRISGEILSMDSSAKDKLFMFLSLLAGFNISLFLLNMLPLLPLDGGHILGALIEWIKRGWAKLFRRKEPEPFDVAKLMPVAYVVVLLFVGLTLLTLVADIINPLTIS